MKYFEFHNLFFAFYREATMKSVKLNSFISLAGQIMEFLTMPQDCFPLYGELNYLTLLVQGLLLSIAGVYQRRGFVFFTTVYMGIYSSLFWSIHHFEVLCFCSSLFELLNSHCSRIWLSTAMFENNQILFLNRIVWDFLFPATAAPTKSWYFRLSF